MRKFLLYFILFSCFSPITASAQFEAVRDSVIQLYGMVMTADSLMALPAASVTIKGQRRGTLTNNQGVFSIAALKGDVIEFSYVGFQSKEIIIPKNLDKKEYSIIQLLVMDTTYLPATIIKAIPTREQFERDFLSANIDDDAIEIARKNTDVAKRRVLEQSLPFDGRESVNFNLAKQAQQYYWKGQMPPIQVFNPGAWIEFINAWKRGDFKKKKN